GTCSTLSAGELRRVARFNADAHRRPTWTTFGDSTGQFTATKFFDRADNLAGVGLPFNGPPAWCGGPSGSSGSALDAPTAKLCAVLKYGRAERLSSFTEYPQGASGGSEATCFGYDVNGNINVVTPGCASTCNSDGTCDSVGLSYATEYTWDDFGHVD